MRRLTKFATHIFFNKLITFLKKQSIKSIIKLVKIKQNKTLIPNLFSFSFIKYLKALIINKSGEKRTYELDEFIKQEKTKEKLYLM